MFRAEARPRLFERRLVRYGLAAAFAAATVLAFIVFRDVARAQPTRHDLFLLGAIILVLAITGMALFLVYRAYLETRNRLTYLKLYAYDILQSLSIGIVTSDLGGTITNVNERARVLAGIEGDGVRRPYLEVLAHLPALAGAIDRLVGRREEFNGLDVDRVSDGRTLTLRLDGRFLLNETGKRIGTILQIQDVSQLKLLDQEMRRTEKLAGLGTLAAGIAHEIKNPLAALSINAQLLEESMEGTPTGKDLKYLRVIRSEIGRLQGIVDKYVSFAKPRSIERAPAALETILEAVLTLVEPECRKKRISIVREGFSSPAPRYLLDEGQIQQAILNLVINAIQAMEKGGTLTGRLGRTGSFVTVDVGDTGPGIPPEVGERLFDLFYTTRQGGTGMGLYLTQRIVAEHKGYIDLKTGPSGTTFTIGMPAESPP